MDNISAYIQEELEKIPFNLFYLVSQFIKSNKGAKIAFVGGVIRDLLIAKFHKKEISQPKDIDIVIEGSSISLAKFIKENISNVEICLIKEFNLYNTVELNINDFKIDIASARKEIYEAPGFNPKIKNTSIEEDLKRRDFTINSIAFEVSRQKIYDFCGGITHIKSKELHFLHKNSIQDDPSRLIRCAKYASRLGFNIAEASLKQSQETLLKWPWEDSKIKEKIFFPPAISIRIRMELSEINKFENLTKVVSKLNEWKTITIINKQIQFNNKFIRGLNWIKKLNGNHILFLLKNSEDLELSCQRFLINSKEKRIMKNYLETSKLLETKKEKYLHLSASDWTEFIEKRNLDIETVKLLICDGGLFWRSFFRWLFIYRFVTSKKNGELLKQEGWEPGKEMGQEMKRLRYLEIDKLKKK